MSWYAVYRTSDGALQSVGTTVAEPLPDGLSQKEYASRPEGVWDPAALDFVAAAAPVHVSRADFLRRFTAAERLAAREARAAGDLVVEDFLGLLSVSDRVDLLHEDTVAGVDYLVSINVLTSSRRNEILGAP